MADTEITDLKDAHDAAENCLLDIERIRTFLSDESSWWKMLKEQSVNCCHEKSPHLHGVLDGSSITLVLHEEGVGEVRFFPTPEGTLYKIQFNERVNSHFHLGFSETAQLGICRLTKNRDHSLTRESGGKLMSLSRQASYGYVASTPKKGSNVAHFSFQNSRASAREGTSETKRTEQERTDAPWEKRTEEYTVPCYSIDMKSTLIEVGRYILSSRLSVSVVF